MQEYFPIVVQVIPQRDYRVQVFLDDGKIVEYDATKDLETEIFRELRDIEVFMNCCTVLNDTLAWDVSGKMDETNCIDIDPFVLYELEVINQRDSMVKEEIELSNYIVVCISEFASRYGMHTRDAYLFLKQNKGISFLREFYDVEHTVSFDDVMEDLVAICKKNGGVL